MDRVSLSNDLYMVSIINVIIIVLLLITFRDIIDDYYYYVLGVFQVNT